jgi:hypothetical protein
MYIYISIYACSHTLFWCVTNVSPACHQMCHQCVSITHCTQLCPTHVQHSKGSSGYHPINRKYAHLAIRKMCRCTTLQCVQCGVWGGCGHAATVAAHVITYPMFPLNQCIGVESLVFTCSRCNSLPTPNGFTAWCGLWSWYIDTSNYDKKYTSTYPNSCLVPTGLIWFPSHRTYVYPVMQSVRRPPRSSTAMIR